MQVVAAKSMHLCLSVFICGFLALCPTQSVAVPITLKDDLGRTVELKAPARRIVTLAPFLTELAFAAGAGDPQRRSAGRDAG